MLLAPTVRIHAAYLQAAARLRQERGQTSAEYALVLLGAASVALLVIAWANSSGKVGDLLDAIFDNVLEMVT